MSKARQPPHRPRRPAAAAPVGRAAKRPKLSGGTGFVAGAERVERLPPAGLPEIAFAGRSNVGKSSLLNRLARRHGLARVSKTPGRTQQINFFAIAHRLLFVDLPGYGFARVPLPVKAQWRELVEGYLRDRPVLCGVMVLVDLRRGIESDDAQLLDFLAAHGIPSIVVATKSDKLARGPGLQALARIAADRPERPPIAFSAATGEGVAAVWQAIEELLSN